MARPSRTVRSRAQSHSRHRPNRPRRRAGTRQSLLTVLTLAAIFAYVALQQHRLIPETIAYAVTTDGSAQPVAVSAAFVDNQQARFSRCHSGGGFNCVVDGDTFWFGGEKIRIADIDTPETHPSRCEREGELGARATDRLHALLNAGPFSLASSPDGRSHDRYGRRLAIVMRGGRSVGDTLVGEGLTRRYSGGPRAGWC